ncbi:MAG: Rrf2 family transcriptional regulator [Rhodomicrobium sp.]|jgi:Rrf2 family iron-sulfur cluster assembly transcriptional regulator
MLLSTKGRYAVMAMVEIAKQGDLKPLSLGDIAARLELSLAYLEQLFMKLRRRGLVQSVRGPGGGYVLGRNADTISIGEIMAAVDEPFKMTRCDSDAGCVATHRCSTHFLWDALGAHIEQFLAAATLGDVLYGRYSVPAEDFLIAKLAARAEVSQ